jgi:hypothetical protein
MEELTEEVSVLLGFVLFRHFIHCVKIDWLVKEFQLISRRTRRYYEVYLQPEMMRNWLNGATWQEIGWIHSTDHCFGRLWSHHFLQLLATRAPAKILKPFLQRMMALTDENRAVGFQPIFLACQQLAQQRVKMALLKESQDWQAWEELIHDVKIHTLVVYEEAKNSYLGSTRGKDTFASELLELPVPTVNNTRPLRKCELNDAAHEWFARAVVDIDIWIIPESAFLTVAHVKPVPWNNMFTREMLDAHCFKFYSHVIQPEDWQFVPPFYGRLLLVYGHTSSETRLFTIGLSHLVELVDSYDDKGLQRAVVAFLKFGRDLLSLQNNRELKTIADLLCGRGLRSFFVSLFTPGGAVGPLTGASSVVYLLPGIDDPLYTGEPMDIFIHGGSIGAMFAHCTSDTRLEEYVDGISFQLENKSADQFIAFLELAATFIPGNQWKERIGYSLWNLLQKIWLEHFSLYAAPKWSEQQFHWVRRVRLAGAHWPWHPTLHQAALDCALERHLSHAQLSLSQEPWLCPCCHESYEKCLEKTRLFCQLYEERLDFRERVPELISHWKELCSIRNSSLFVADEIIVDDLVDDNEECLQQDWSIEEEEEEV